ncbi:hypothetical protein QTP86_007917 [Hemibagrus guttatus]|nr:hypothetical protein QTP86_007917 [Hemibagrus guttatus]
MRVGCWNVRTLYQTGKLVQTVNEMNRYNLDLLAITEARWTQTGKQKLNTGELIIWSGRKDDNHDEGVALIINKKQANALLQWKPISERLLYVRMNSRYIKLSILVAYAPINAAAEEDKDQFYSTVQAALEDIPGHDVLLLMGDFNARVGSNNLDRERIMGRHGEGECTENGERLIDLCEENNLVIGGTLFQHKTIHKLTWTSPDRKTRSQIDHIIINGKWRRSLQDVRVMRHADAGSDHNLVVAKLTLKLRKAKIGDKRSQRFDVAKLKEPTAKKEFSISLKNRFAILQDDAALTIDSFNKALKEAAEETIGYRKNVKTEWISNDTWKTIEERRQIKKKLLDSKSPRLKERITSWYREKDREVKTSTRRDKRRHIEQLAEDAERAAEQKDMKTVYMTTKKLRGDRGQNQDIPVRAKDGTPITEEYAKLKRWKEHFRQILNRPDPPALADIPEADEDLDIDMGDIRVEEVKAAIHKMKNGKAPGEDGVCPEMLKAEEEETPLVLQCVLQDIWEKERCPDIWRIGTIIKLPKKGDLGDCNNWRGITLLPLTSKVFCRIILQRIIAAVDIKLRQEQAGFRKGKSCIDHIFTLRQILEQSHEWNSPLYLLFVDFEKAFDSLHRDSLWKILRHYGIPKKLVTIIQDLYKNFECRVIHNNELTKPFNVHTGVKQGCILHQDIQQKTEKLSEIASTIGLKVNNKKTQVLRKNVTSNTPISIDGTPLEDVQKFVYLGSKVTTDGDCNKDINTRVSKANQAFAMLKPIWRTTSLSIHTKIKIFRSNVISVLLYGSECWKTTTAIEQKLEVFQNKCLRRILKIFWPNTISNEELRRRTGANSIQETIQKRRWRWLGHVCRMPPDSLPRIALRWTPQGKRNRGRPKETWRRTVEKDLKSRGLTLETAPRTAADRAKWSSLAIASSTRRRRED